MFISSGVSLIWNCAFYAYGMQINGDQTYMKYLANDLTHKQINTISIMGAVGQIFIFFTISMHNCHTLTIITTTRKCLSVVMSAIAFSHPFT